MKKPTRGLFLKGTFLTLVLVFIFSAVPIRPALAQVDTIGGPVTVVMKAIKVVTDKLDKALKKVGSAMVQTAITNSLKRIAYDTATWVGSGANGQKPQFTVKGVGNYLADVADSAAGDYIDAFASNLNVNFCQPNLDVKIKIGLGLVDQANGAKIKDSKCKFTTMMDTWQTDLAKKYEDMGKPDYLKNLSTMFDVGGSDLTVAMDVMDGMKKEIVDTKEKKKTDLSIEGWLPNENIGGQTTEAPRSAKLQLETAVKTTAEAQKVNISESPVTDAAKVFLNTLATTAFNKALKNLAGGNFKGVLSDLTFGLYKDKTEAEIAQLIADGGYYGNRNKSCLDDPNCDPNSAGGLSAVQSNLADMIKPSFDSRGDYNILSELSVCPDPSKPGPTNCILDSQFSSAISDQKTVIEAVKDGSLNKTWRLKRDIDFNQGYSLRSLLVLRKFRIIPVGWETALLKAEENNANVTLMDMVSCFDPNDNYNEFSQGFTPSSWCQGLIDPNWVLKAPLSYCKRQGYGNQVLDKTITPEQIIRVSGQPDETIPGEIILTRADEYCADEQSCIKEKADGTCEAYGYCTEEKRTWDFTSDSCDAVYNTCQSFIKSNGASVAYLENTIDYSTCTADNTGCRPYSVSGSYTTSSDKINWNATNHIYFSKKAEVCDSSQEGCNELIRINPDTGHNFLINSDFEEDLSLGSWNVNTDDNNVSTPNSATTSPSGYFSNTSLALNGLLSKNIAVGPNDYNISGRTYTFSFYAKNCVGGNQAVFGSSQVDNKVINLGESIDWNYYYITYNFPLGLTDNQVYFSIDSADCQIDRLKLELAKFGTEYSDYYQSNLVYQKLIPDYLALTCYENPNSATPDYRLKANAPAKCSSYTRRCNALEVDCNLYQSVRDGFTLPAKVTPIDSCLAECDGYDSYVQKSASFQNTLAANFIPSTATKCSANAVGCTEFTNLDSVALGGEGKEYYSSLRQCIKPDNNECGVFYSWGSAGSGYQLQPYKLQALSNGPKLTVGGFDGNRNQVDGNSNIVCSEAIYNASPSSANYNADCRELYNKDGAIYYALYSKTITCSDDCHPYRISEAPIDETITVSSSCANSNQHWDAQNNVCYVCKNGGTWDLNQNGCIYQAIPGEGQSCSASENGCREYNGNYGNTLRIISAYNFEDNRVWASYNQASSALVSDSINKNGHSLQYNPSGGSGSNNFNLNPITVSTTGSNYNIFSALKGLWGKVVKGAEAQSGNALPAHGIGVTVGQSVNEGSAYVLRFLAKASSPVAVNAYLSNGTVASPFNINSQNNGSITVSGNNEWKMYTISLASVDHAVNDQEALLFSASGSVLLDSIALTEVTDRFYLIKDSWKTPDSCYYDTFNTYQGANYNLGCGAYTDKNKQVNYFRNFSRLCQDSAVGCELMSLTNNSANPAAEAFRESGTIDNQCDSSDSDSCVEVSADKMVYVVYNESKQCGSDNKGCTRLGGQVVTNQDVTVQNLYTDTYIKNNPDKYESTLCGEAEVGCDEWKYLDGQSSYFKDPGDNVCQWRQPVNAIGMNLPKKWYKKAIKRCDFNGNNKIDTDTIGNITEAQNKLCSTDSDCGLGTCILDSNDYLCNVDSLKTIGLGGGNLVYQPKDMVGVCEAKASTCTEYVDPVSEFSPNIVINPGWGDTNKDGIVGDGWSTSTTQIVAQKQTIYLLKNKLYSLSVNASGASYDTTLSCQATVRILGMDNSFGTATNLIVIPKTSTNKNILFNSLNNVSCTLYGGEANKVVNVRGTVVDYKLLAGVDKTSCNGAADFNTGCIMFNERKQSGSAGLSGLNWNAYGGSYLTGSPITSTSTADSNVLVKVKPNRVCSKWLSCLSMGIDATTGEEVCYALGECDKLNDFGRCQSFVTKPEIQHTFDSGSDRNIAGYSKMDNYYLSNMSEVGEDLSNLANWGFEAGDTNFSFSSPNYSTTSAYGLPKQISYPAVGKGLAIIGSNASLSSFSVIKDKEYFINFLINIDTTGGLGGSLKVSGVNSSWSTTTSIVLGSGWQRKVLRFVPGSTGNATIQLISNGSGSNVYFDDISVEPVLKAADSSYIPKECRLYPKQDSLSCKSDNSGVTANGIYGYCLEHDPKNPDVCIMWYPIDNVKSSQASVGTFSGYNGYNGVINPYYCAEMRPNFQFLEKRVAYFNYRTQVEDGCVLDYGFPSENNCPAGYKRFYVRWQHSGGDYCATDNFCIPAGINSRVSRVCDPNDASAVVPDPDGCAQIAYPSNSPISYDKSWDNETTIVPSPSVSGGPGGYDPWIEVIGDGYYIYNGNQGHDVGSEMNKYLVDYDDDPNGVKKPVANFTPKCTQFIKGEKPWVQRLTSDVTGFFTSSPYTVYRQTLSALPYGSSPIGNVVGPIGSGSTNTGYPYSCVPAAGLTNNGADLCNTISINSGGAISLNYLGNSSNKYSSPSPSITPYYNNLKQLFLKGVGSGTYHYEYSPQPCPSAGRPANDPVLSFCSVDPKINSDIKLRDIEGNLIPLTADGYSVVNAGYYTLSFGVDINPEQFPVGKLVIDFGDGSGNLTATQIDPSNNYNFVHYYNPQSVNQKYKIRIKVEDNWGSFKCSGLPNTIQCQITCCDSTFTDQLGCSGCL